MAEPRIRPERPGEWPALRAVIEAAFAPHTAAGPLAEWLHERDAVLSLVAEVGGEVGGEPVGHVLFSTLPLRGIDGAPDGTVLCLSPLSVLAGFRRRGIARSLVAAGLAALADRPEPLVVLEGSPVMYAKFGFRPAREFGVERPTELIPEPAFQAGALPTYRPGLRGRVEYPQHFYDVGAVGPS